jgi:mRNA interferase HigB
LRIIKRSRLKAFWEDHSDAEVPLKVWRAMMKKPYRTPAELKADFSTASFLADNVTVFNVGGGKYRLVVSMRYDMQMIFIRHQVTHEEYDRLSTKGLL